MRRVALLWGAFVLGEGAPSPSLLRNATLSSLCRSRDISLRPEGVFQRERQRISQIQHQLAESSNRLPLWGSCLRSRLMR